MKDNSKKRKIAIYIDGSNLYFSVKKTFNIKIDIEKLCKKLIKDNDLVKINYYTPAYIKLHPWFKNLAGYPAFEELINRKTK